MTSPMAQPTRALLFVACMTPLLWQGCASPSLPATDAYAQRFVGAWRVSRQDQASCFSDYHFGATGTLTHLLSVAQGMPVDPMSGATMVSCPAEPGSPACAFGDSWHSFDADTLVVSGQCSDGVEREIELAFSDETHAAQVTVRSVGGATNWLQPDWRFQKCDQKACAE